MKITRLGLDLAKNVIQLHAVDARNEVMGIVRVRALGDFDGESGWVCLRCWS